MWISRKEFRALKDEVAELKRRHESHVVDVADNRNFTVYEPKALKEAQDYSRLMGHYGHFMPSIPSQRMSVKDVLGKVLDKLGMELVYVEGQPTKVEMREKEKTNVSA